jgi:drug/metabolite transporter (DMT)-like permease
MPTKFLFVAFTVNSVISQLILRRGLQSLTIPQRLSGLPTFISGAALSPWIYASVILQILSYLMWMAIVSRENLGVAAATAGAGYYALMALAAWIVYGETLTLLQCAGIALVTLGVVCISLGGARI